MNAVDVVVVGAGPAGLATAEAIALGGFLPLVIEQNPEIGSPTRTTGGSFIKDLRAFGIPDHLYHPIGRGRFLSANNSATFEFPEPTACVIDVRRVLQFLAEKAIIAGAKIKVGTTVHDIILQNDYVVGVKAKDTAGEESMIQCRIVIDASGHNATISKKAGLHAGFSRFGVGAEYDMYAPNCDQDEIVVIGGSQIAPAGYAWSAPWGNKRVRVGVGIIHPDSTVNPKHYLDKLIRESASYGINLDHAEPIEYHYGLVPSDGPCYSIVGNGIMAVGDAAGQASALIGEGIRWSIKAGKMAGEVAAQAISNNNCSRQFLAKYERRWNAKYGKSLRVADEINKRVVKWSDDQWDEIIELIKPVAPIYIGRAIESNFTVGLAFRILLQNPQLIKQGIVVLKNLILRDRSSLS